IDKGAQLRQVGFRVAVVCTDACPSSAGRQFTASQAGRLRDKIKNLPPRFSRVFLLKSMASLYNLP
ncbi:hypothetical protein, partial [Paraburkholderia aspalathi]|uniref:hypothetical protein n=1 Tax=Paraburkholderia aspalathi TaxID=1324617 RepID=UPI001F404303